VVWTCRLNAAQFNAQLTAGRTFEVLALVVSRVKWGDERDIDIYFRKIFCENMNRSQVVKSDIPCSVSRFVSRWVSQSFWHTVNNLVKVLR